MQYCRASLPKDCEYTGPVGAGHAARAGGVCVPPAWAHVAYASMAACRARTHRQGPLCAQHDATSTQQHCQQASIMCMRMWVCICVHDCTRLVGTCDTPMRPGFCLPRLFACGQDAHLRWPACQRCGRPHCLIRSQRHCCRCQTCATYRDGASARATEPAAQLGRSQRPIHGGIR